MIRCSGSPQAELQEHKGRLALANPNPKIQELFEELELTEALSIHPDLASALEALKEPLAPQLLPTNEEEEPHSIPIPFLKGEVGLGDLIKRATSAVGIKPCGGCQKRAERLNRFARFKGRS